MLRGVLFDLDGTLLDLDLDAFLQRYFAAVSRAASPSFPGVELMPAILAATRVMQGRHPGRTNREVFFEAFRQSTGIDLSTSWDVFGDFYRDVFPTLGEGCAPAAGAREAVQKAKSLGLKVAVATQPIFPREAIAHRLAWAGLDDIAFDVVTTYEIMEACKPLPEYFVQTARMLGCEPGECLMIGDDLEADMPAAETGMTTFYVGRDDARSTSSGTVREVVALLEGLAGSAPDQ